MAAQKETDVLGTLRRRLSYANVIATLALFIALGGSSYAAIKVTGANVKDGSLTGKDVRDASLAGQDLKKDAVTSREVRDGSLLAADFAPGQAPAGAQGPKGDKGDPGEKGERGEKGDRGPAGSDASLNDVDAGGALTGKFPNPGLAINSVGGAQVAPNALTGADIDESTLANVPSAANADKLGGEEASAYQRRCQAGTIAAHATVWTGNLTATPRNAGMYGGETAFNCKGGAPTVKKIATGQYEFSFPGGHYGFAMVSANDYGRDTTYSTAANGPWGGDGKVSVYVRNSAGAYHDPYYLSVVVPAP